MLNNFGCGGHLGRSSEMLDTILEEDHPRISSAKFGWDWLSSFREDFFLNFIPPFFLICIISKSSKFIKNPVIYVLRLQLLITHLTSEIFVCASYDSSILFGLTSCFCDTTVLNGLARARPETCKDKTLTFIVFKVSEMPQCP